MCLKIMSLSSVLIRRQFGIIRGNRMKTAHQESGKSSLSKKETGSKIRTSSQLTNGSHKPQTKKCKQRMKSYIKNGDSNLCGTVTGSLSKGTRKDSTNQKAVSGVVLPKTLSSKVAKKQPSSKENEGNADEDFQKLKKRRQRKRQKKKVELDEAPRLQRRSRYLLIKMKLEQNLIDAYSGEGWKGQSREKIRPEKELQRAKKQILKCKLGLRDAIRHLESLSSVGCIEDSAIAPDGSVYHEHIICAKCKLREAFPDNDIILCDGTCNCAFHQKCLDPPLETKNIPPDDQGWLCRFCECKVEIIEAMNAHLGTRFSVNSSWQDIFKEEAALPEGEKAYSNMEEDWPSDDSEDDDYDPEKNEYNCSISRADTEDSGSDDANSSCSLSWSAEREILSGSGMSEKRTDLSKSKSIHLTDSVDSDDTNDHEIIIGRRQRRAVDYRKLYDEMFGKDAPAYEQLSEDEDWGPAKRRRREKESDAASTLMALCESEKKNSDDETKEIKRGHHPDQQTKRSVFRIPLNAVQKLRQAFAENELPSRSVKESLSNQLGLDSEKVNKWFKNARYLALKTRKVEEPSVTHRISSESKVEIVKNQTANPEASTDTSTENLVRTPKNLKKLCRRKNPKSLTSPKKRQRRRPLLVSSSKSEKVIMEVSDDLSLKKQMQLIRSKSKREKKNVNFMPEGDAQAAEMEMERLCRVKSKIENMKQAISRLKNTTCNSDEAQPKEQVIYVPVAELREKS